MDHDRSESTTPLVPIIDGVQELPFGMQTPSVPSPDEPREKQSTVILSLTKELTLFSTPDRRAYASVPVREHQEMMSITGREFSSWLALLYYKHAGSSPSTSAVKEALNILESKALFDPISKTEKIHIRIAGDDKRVWLDLADSERRIVEITARGWKVVAKCTAKFKRPSGIAALPVPEKHGSLSELRRFINCSDTDFMLIVGWLVGAFKPGGPFPILEIDGEQGSAKSSLTKLLKKLIDPTEALLNSPPRDAQDVALIANSEYVVAYDNLSGLSSDLQDVFCRTATGGAFKTRKLYSNDEVETFHLLVPIIFNSIGGVATRPDLLDRLVKVVLPAITEKDRIDEQKYWQNFSAALPKILGALCDCISSAIKALPSTTLTSKPRLADFASWIQAAETYLQHDPALNWKQGDFLSVFSEAQAAAANNVLDGDEFAQAVISMAREKGYWSGSASELHAQLSAKVSESAKRSKYWPAVNKLHDRLLRIQPLLRKENVLATKPPRTRSGSTYVVQELTDPGDGSVTAD